MIHPQSVVHSLVEYVDGSVIVQLSNPHMRVPIADALGYPERIESGARPLDLGAIGQLSFERPDSSRFPFLALTYGALRHGGAAPAVLNAASAIETALAAVPADPATDLATVLAADTRAQRAAAEYVSRYE